MLLKAGFVRRQDALRTVGTLSSKSHKQEADLQLPLDLRLPTVAGIEGSLPSLGPAQGARSLLTGVLSSFAPEGSLPGPHMSCSWKKGKIWHGVIRTASSLWGGLDYPNMDFR